MKEATNVHEVVDTCDLMIWRVNFRDTDTQALELCLLKCILKCFCVIVGLKLEINFSSLQDLDIWLIRDNNVRLFNEEVKF